MRLFRIQLHLWVSMATIGFIALGIAALRSSSFPWLRTVNTIVVTMLLLAALVAWHFEGSRRDFAVGFVVFSVAYYFLAFGPVDGWHLYDEQANKGFGRTEVRPNLITSPFVIVISQYVTRFPEPGTGLETYDQVSLRSTWIGHLLLTPVVGCGGGAVSRVLAKFSERSANQPKQNGA